MEEAPTPMSIEISKEKIIEAIKDNTKIIFRLNLIENNLKISTEIKESLIHQIYEGIFSKKEIQNNKYFLKFDTMNEITDELVLKSKSESPKVSKEIECLSLKISLSPPEFKDIEFILKPKRKSNEDKFKELYDIVTELKQENTDLKINLKKLNDENTQMREQIKKLIDFTNKIEEKTLLKIDSNILNDDKDKIKTIKEFITPNKNIKVELDF